ncbi:MAG: hypothetical protein ACPG8V_02365 [Alphaproteobacteria bacterium]
MFANYALANESLSSAEDLVENGNGTILTIEDAEVEEVAEDTENLETASDEEFTETPVPEIKPIDVSVADTVGVYDSESGGLNIEYWKNRSYSQIENVLNNLDINTKSPAYNKALRRMILSKTNVPKPDKEGNEGNIAQIKVNLLIKSGRFNEAKALIQKIPSEVRLRLFSKQIVKMALVDFDNRLACDTMDAQEDETRKKSFWQATELTCLTVGFTGDEFQKQFISEKLNEIDKENIKLPDGIRPLILFHVFKQEVKSGTKIDLNVWTLNLMRLIDVGVDVPNEIDDIYVKRGLLFNKNIDDYTRLKLAEDMFENDAIGNEKLYAVYNSMANDFKVEPVVDKETGEEIFPETYQRYLVFKKALSVTGMNRINVVLANVKNAKTYKDKVKSVRIFTPMLEDVSPFAGVNAVKVAKMFYAIGNYEKANEWMERNEDALWFERAVLEPMNNSKNQIVFSQDYGVFNFEDGAVEQEESSGGLFGLFGGGNDEEAEEETTATSSSIVNRDPLALNVKDRKKWMKYLVKNQTKNTKGIAGLKMGQAFSMLEAIEYEISDASWLYASKHSKYTQTMTLSPAKSKALEIFVKNAKDPVYILIVIKQFINQVELDDAEFAKVINVLYRAGYKNIVREIIFERGIMYL